MDPIQWLKDDIAEIKLDLKEMKKDIKKFDYFRIKILSGAAVISFIVAVIFKIVIAYMERT